MSANSIKTIASSSWNESSEVRHGLGMRLSRLGELEIIIESNVLSFMKVGMALFEITQKKLYQPEYKTFKEYLANRWKWAIKHAYRLMNAFYIRQYLENCPDGQFLPNIEGTIRPLTKLATFKQVEMEKKEPSIWAKAWKATIEIAEKEGKPITEKHTKTAVDQIIRAAKVIDIPSAPVWSGEWELNKIYEADVTTKEWLDSMPEGNVDLIITDPPWRPDEDGKSYKLYEAAAEMSAKVLKPGGICGIYLGKLDLPILMNIMLKHLQYEWCMAVYYPGGAMSFRKTQFKECWRPIGIFRKAGKKNQTVYYPDALTSKRDKEYHEWQQGIEPVRILIEKYTAPGQLILDPYIGSGSVIVGAETAESGKRKWLAFDNSQESIKSANRRLKDAGIFCH